MQLILAIVALCTHTAYAERFVMNNIKHLHLSEQKWKIQYVLNMTEYVETSNLLHECVNMLNTVCEDKPNQFCSYFQHATKNINTDIEIDIAKLKALVRHKRFIFFIPILIGVSVISLLGGIAIAKSTMNSLKSEIQGNLDIIEQAANISITTIDIQERIIKDIDGKFHSLELVVHNNTRQINALSQFNNIINSILFTAHIHEKMQMRLNHIYSGEIHTRLFEIIDYSKFLLTVEDINKKLGPNLKLPKFDSMKKNNLIEAYSQFNKTHLMISVDLPVIQKDGHFISELIPIPINENGTLFLLDLKETIFFKGDSNYRLLSDETLKSLCKTNKKQTICNNFLEDLAEKVPMCLHNLLMELSDVNCIYKEIPFANYFIRVSEQYIYAFIVNPIKIVKGCGGADDIIYLTQSTRVFAPKGCELFKYSDKNQYKEKTISSINMTPQSLHSHMNLSLQEISEQLSSIPLWDSYEMRFMKAKTRVKRLQKDMPLQKEKIENIQIANNIIDGVVSQFSIGGFDIGSYFSNKIVQFLILIIFILLLGMCAKELVFRFLLDWRSRSSDERSS